MKENNGEKQEDKRRFMKPQKSSISDGCQKPRRLMKPGKNNKEDRINFVKFWADYVRTHSDKEWSEQQNVVINSQFQG
jgi:hypothetical protein